jgi:hypothetical protein
MANAHGFRSTYVRTRKNYLNQGNFRVRYWSLPKLKELFTEKIGPTTISAEAFGGLGLLALVDGEWQNENPDCDQSVLTNDLADRTGAGAFR